MLDVFKLFLVLVLIYYISMLFIDFHKTVVCYSTVRCSSPNVVPHW